MLISIAVCLLAWMMLLALLRRGAPSLGLPFAYMLLLLLLHVPGAWAATVTKGIYGEGVIDTGIRLTAIGAVAFVAGVWLARRFDKSPTPAAQPGTRRAPSPRQMMPWAPRQFLLFCLFGGWLLIFGVSLLLRLPSIGAVVEKGGAIWILGVMLGLNQAFHRRAWPAAALWSLALVVYPIVILVIGGFIGYGVAIIVLAGSLLAITLKRYWMIVGTVALVSVLGLSLFVTYFGVRTELRQAAWAGASIERRAEVASKIVTQFRLFDAQNPSHLEALDKRLNQNLFVGLSAERLRYGQVEYLGGRSVWEGAIALVPRALWPDKPVFGGSGTIVADMTGLNLNHNTSWGVGNVMEFYINFGLVGLVGGFLILGWLIGFLDRRAAHHLVTGGYGQSAIFFLPCLALIQPNGSMVELSGGAAAALAAGFFWRWAWRAWSARQRAAMAPMAHRRL